MARLYVNALANEMTPRDIKRVLAELDSISFSYSKDTVTGKARTLDSAYDGVMKRIESQAPRDLDLAKLILSWITCSKRPLTSLELQHATAVETGAQSLDVEGLADIDDLVSVCAGLVVVDQESNIVRLVHYTTQEYFNRFRGQWFPDAHAKIAQASLTYLNFRDFEMEDIQAHDPYTQEIIDIFSKALTKRTESFPLYGYAARFWGHHARGTLMEKDPMALAVLQRSPKRSLNTSILIMSDWRLRYNDDLAGKQRQEVKRTGLQVAAYFGLLQSATILIAKNPQSVFEYPALSGSPLHIAVLNGWVNLTEFLLDKGAIFDHAVVKAAMRNKDQEMLCIFIRRELLVIGCGENDTMGLYALEHAVAHRQEEIVKLLLEQGVKPSPACPSQSMNTAASCQHSDTLKFLMETGAMVQSESGGTPLLTAVRKGHIVLVKFFLEQRPKPRPASLFQAMKLALVAGSTEMLELFLENGAVLEPDSGNTPLSAASDMGPEEIFKFLLEKGARPTRRNKSGDTPLSSALPYEYYAIAFVLLMNGAIPESDSLKAKLLLAAAEFGVAKAVSILLDLQAHIETKDSDGYTALWLAIKESRPKIAQILIENGADVEGRNRNGESLFEFALRYQNPIIVRLIKERLSQLSTISSDTELEPSDCELDLDSD